MGMYLNPGKAAFEEAVNSEIYIDKTQLIGYLNSVVKTKQKYLSVSRPRRFGKTITADMICAYYGRDADSRKMFEKRKIASYVGTGPSKWDAYLGQFDVVRLVMTDFFKPDITIADALNKIKKRVLDELEECYPNVGYDADDVLSLLIHLGYLGFDDGRSEVFIPNREILDEFRTSTKGGEWKDTFKSFEDSLALLDATWKCNENTVAEFVEN